MYKLSDISKCVHARASSISTSLCCCTRSFPQFPIADLDPCIGACVSAFVSRCARASAVRFSVADENHSLLRMFSLAVYPCVRAASYTRISASYTRISMRRSAWQSRCSLMMARVSAIKSLSSAQGQYFLFHWLLRLYTMITIIL